MQNDLEILSKYNFISYTLQHYAILQPYNLTIVLSDKLIIIFVKKNFDYIIFKAILMLIVIFLQEETPTIVH